MYILCVCGKIYNIKGFPGGSVVRNLPANAGDLGLIPRSIRSPGGENGNLLQYSCLKKPMDRGTWWAVVHGVAENPTRQHTCMTHTA